MMTRASHWISHSEQSCKVVGCHGFCLQSSVSCPCYDLPLFLNLGGLPGLRIHPQPHKNMSFYFRTLVSASCSGHGWWFQRHAHLMYYHGDLWSRFAKSIEWLGCATQFRIEPEIMMIIYIYIYCSLVCRARCQSWQMCTLAQCSEDQY